MLYCQSMILGHYANTYVVHKLVKRYNIELNLYLLLFGAYLPDLIDKPLNKFFLLPGRGIAHSVIVQALFFLPFLFLMPRYKRSFLSVWFGCILHLIQDTVLLSIAFWPIVGDLSDHRRFSVVESFYNFYVEVKYPYTLLAEIISFILCGCFSLYEWIFNMKELAEEKVILDDRDYNS